MLAGLRSARPVTWQPTVCLSVCPRLLPSNALLLTAPGPQDSAQFECVVSNEVGEARRLYQVTIHGELGRGQSRKLGWGGGLLSWVLSSPERLELLLLSLLCCMDHLLQEALSDPALPT